MFEGRSADAKKLLIMQLFQNIESIGIAPHSVETPKENWGI